jgi:hypothetical protein
MLNFKNDAFTSRLPQFKLETEKLFVSTAGFINQKEVQTVFEKRLKNISLIS